MHRCVQHTMCAAHMENVHMHAPVKKKIQGKCTQLLRAFFVLLHFAKRPEGSGGGEFVFLLTNSDRTAAWRQ